MKVCVLLPSYARSGMLKEYASCDPARDLAPLVPEWRIETHFLDKATVYSQLKSLKRNSFDVFVNLCEGHLEWDIPSIDVIYSLEALDLAYTGPTPALYEPKKLSLKAAARAAGVPSPRFVLAQTTSDVKEAEQRLHFPVFVKPNEGGDSFGIDIGSLCNDTDALRRRLEASLAQFDTLMIEEYIPGREFSALVMANCDDHTKPRVLKPVEFVFPRGSSYKTYDLKNQQYHPSANIAVDDSDLRERLMDAATKLFVSYNGVGYCRIDFRMNEKGDIHAIDANFTCSVFYPEGYYGTADYILQKDGFGASNFLRQIVQEGLQRHHKKLATAIATLKDLYD